MELLPWAKKRKSGKVRHHGEKYRTAVEDQMLIFNKHSSANLRRDQYDSFKTGMPMARLIFLWDVDPLISARPFIVLVCIPSTMQSHSIVSSAGVRSSASGRPAGRQLAILRGT